MKSLSIDGVVYARVKSVTQLTSNQNALVFMQSFSAMILLLMIFNSRVMLGLKTLVTRLAHFSKERLDAWKFLRHGPEMIQEAFDKAKGRPFQVMAPDHRQVFVSSPSQIEELNRLPNTHLSLQAAGKDVVQPSYTMHGFSWFDRRGVEGLGFVRTLRTFLTNHIPQLMPVLEEELRSKTSKLLANNEAKGTSRVQIFPMVTKLVVQANAIAFFGNDLPRNETFMKATFSFVKETFMTAEIIRLSPSFLRWIVGPIVRRRRSSQAIVYEHLVAQAKQRVLARDQGIEHTKHKQQDCMQWIMETAPKGARWSAERIAFELIILWFGSIHSLSATITFVIQDLCLHPEYVAPLRKELQGAKILEQTAENLPLLDSFIKETTRLTPSESLSMRRKILTPFTLADGTRLHVGDWICTPHQAIMQERTHYPHPLEFNGFRFVDPAILNADLKAAAINNVMQPDGPSKLVDPATHFHVWGTGRIMCPGRYYAAAFMKTFLANIILNYDVELVDPQARRKMSWRSSFVPVDSSEVLFKPLRDGE